MSTFSVTSSKYQRMFVVVVVQSLNSKINLNYSKAPFNWTDKSSTLIETLLISFTSCDLVISVVCFRSDKNKTDFTSQKYEH